MIREATVAMLISDKEDIKMETVSNQESAWVGDVTSPKFTGDEE
jgi:hypothetical protein